MLADENFFSRNSADRWMRKSATELNLLTGTGESTKRKLDEIGQRVTFGLASLINWLPWQPREQVKHPVGASQRQLIFKSKRRIVGHEVPARNSPPSHRRKLLCWTPQKLRSVHAWLGPSLTERSQHQGRKSIDPIFSPVACPFFPCQMARLALQTVKSLGRSHIFTPV